MSKICNTRPTHLFTPISPISSFNSSGIAITEKCAPLSCPKCDSTDLIFHNLGLVCPDCGIVHETQVFETRIPYYHDRTNILCTYHTPKGYPTMVGKKEERINSTFRNLNHIHHIFREGLLEEARNFFHYYLAILDLNMKVDNLVISFRKIYSNLPKFSRTKNIANLSFAILFKTAQPIYCLKLNPTCEQCGCDLRKILEIFKDLKQYQQFFEDDDISIILHSLSILQEKCGFLSEDVPYIRKILRDPFTCGLLPQIKAAKALILYLKAKQLTKFFQILQNEKITDWITLLRHVSDPEWRNWVESQVQPLNLQDIAQELQISKTQVYECYCQETWVRSRVVATSPNTVIKCGSLRIPEKLLETFFTRSSAAKLKN